MYHPDIIARKIALAVQEARTVRDAEGNLVYGADFSLVRYSIEESIRNTAAIQALVAPSTRPGESPRLLRPLNADELAFIQNDMFISQYDFRYWVERYPIVELDRAAGGIGHIKLWGSQELLLEQIAIREKAMWESFWEQKLRGYADDEIRVKGIIIVLPKARQLGATVISQLLVLHRTIFSKAIRAVIASADETKSKELFNTKYLAFYNRLPFWMRPEVASKQADGGIRFKDSDVHLLLQHGAQEQGVGQGGTTTVSHLTEVGSWYKPDLTIKKHFLNSIPWTLDALSIWESTGEDIGTWFHRFVVERTKQMQSGADDPSSRVDVVFPPWYAHHGKYRLPAPPDWVPSPDTEALRQKILETSPRYFNGRVITPHRDQLYWYESERVKALRENELPFFLGDYPTTLDEAFQSQRRSTFSAVVLNRLSLMVRSGKGVKALEFVGESRKLRPADFSIAPGDPRGILFIYEAPQSTAQYVLGVDATRGIPNWDRTHIKEGDHQTDNFACEILRVGLPGKPDVQVAEFAAPIPPEDAAFVVNFLGRMYRGRDPEGALVVVETWPSPGVILQDRLISEFNYWNLWQRSDVSTGRYAREYGWEANSKTVPGLWARTKRHIAFERVVPAPGGGQTLMVKFVLHSEHLLDEFRTCEEDPKLMVAKAEHGFHDDRVRAIQLAILGAHDWANYDPSEEVPAAVETASPDWQHSDITLEEIKRKTHEMLSNVMSGSSANAAGVLYRGRASYPSAVSDGSRAKMAGRRGR